MAAAPPTPPTPAPTTPEAAANLSRVAAPVGGSSMGWIALGTLAGLVLCAGTFVIGRRARRSGHALEIG